MRCPRVGVFDSSKCIRMMDSCVVGRTEAALATSYSENKDMFLISSAFYAQKLATNHQTGWPDGVHHPA